MGETNLERLHKSRLDGILHEDGESTRASDVVGGDGISSLGRSDDHLTESDGRKEGEEEGKFSTRDDEFERPGKRKNEPLLHILEVVAESENSHTFTGDGDIEPRDSRETPLGSGLTDGDLPEVSIVDVENSVPIEAEKQRRSARSPGDKGKEGRTTNQVIVSGSTSRRANLDCSSVVRSSGLVLVIPSF